MSDFTTKGEIVPLLDQGWVMLVDYMGSDEACVKRARLSFNGDFRGWDKEGPLLAFLMRHGHKSVFQAARLVVRTQLPIETVREIDRHRTLDLHGDLALLTLDSPTEIITVDPRRKFVNKNEASGRYIDMTTLPFRRVPLSRVGRKGTTNKQGTEGEVSLDVKEQFITESDALKTECQEFVKKWTNKDGPNLSYEVVRGNLPLDQYTIIELDGDALWWMDFMRQRLAAGAKAEVREFAEIISRYFAALFPRLYELFEEFVLYEQRYSRTQMKAVKAVVTSLFELAGPVYGEDSEGGEPQIVDLPGFVEWVGKLEGLSGGALTEFVASLMED